MSGSPIAASTAGLDSRGMDVASDLWDWYVWLLVLRLDGIMYVLCECLLFRLEACGVVTLMLIIIGAVSLAVWSLCLFGIV